MKVQVEVRKPSGDIAILSYEAPDDSAIGDVGTVPMFSRDVARDVICPAKIVSLRTAYAGVCKKFTPTTTNGPIDPTVDPPEGRHFVGSSLTETAEDDR